MDTTGIPVTERSYEELPAAVQAVLAYAPAPSLDVPEPQPELVRMLREHPRLRWEGGVAFFRMEDIVAAGRNPAIVTSDAAYGSMGAREPLIPLHVDGDTHTRFRRLLDPLLAPRQIAYLEDDIRALADELIDTFADRGTVELHDEFAVPLPCTTFLRLAGLPVEDLHFLNGVKDEILKNDATTQEEHARIAQEAGDRLRANLAQNLDQREQEGTPRDDLIGRFMTFEVDGQRLSRDEIMNIVHLFVIAGLDTVTASLTCIVGWFARHPDEQRRVMEDPSLLPAAIEELMRFENPVLTSGGRMAIADTEVNGVPVRKGDSVSLCWSTGDLDPDAFPDALAVDLARPGNRHIAFAAGRHRCLGSHLARLELRVAVDQLHRRLGPYRLTPGESPRYNHAGVRAAEYLPLTFATPPLDHSLSSHDPQ